MRRGENQIISSHSPSKELLAKQPVNLEPVTKTFTLIALVLYAVGSLTVNNYLGRLGTYIRFLTSQDSLYTVVQTYRRQQRSVIDVFAQALLAYSGDFNFRPSVLTQS